MTIFDLFVFLLNFFFLDRNLKKCAKYHGDKHLNKMQTEYAQIASAVWWVLSRKDEKLKKYFNENIKEHIYLDNHQGHPIVLWASQSESHLLAVIELGLELAEEKKVREKLAREAGKTWKLDHRSTPILQFIKQNLPPIESFELADEWQDPPLCMPNSYAIMGADTVEAYRFFYVGEKVNVKGIKWAPYATDPEFVEVFQKRLKNEFGKPHPNQIRLRKMDIVYKGEKNCAGKYKSGAKKGQKCEKPAYYVQDGQPLCGVHSDKNHRKELPINPKKKENAADLAEERDSAIYASALENSAKGLVGKVCCRKLKMMSVAPHVPGFYSIFPNYKHGGRSDGIGVPSLSPMSLGPVKGVGQLPEATNLENWWQGQKLYKEEIDRYGNVAESFYLRRDAMFADPIPHRRKENMNSEVEAWLWTNNEGHQIRYKYVSSRQFYCNVYERLSENNTDLEDLRNLMKQGMNLNIIGYDGFDFEKAEGRTPAEKLMKCYLDDKRPFGHELVIVSLLLLKPEEYPWRIHKTADF